MIRQCSLTLLFLIWSQLTFGQSLLADTKSKNGICWNDPNAQPIPLSMNYECPLHFYCPNISSNNPISRPSMCPPTQECLIDRLESKFCTAQGRYEPEICQRGYFCPTFRTKFRCPAGHWCPIGSIEPKQCPPMSYCPTGSSKQVYYGGVIICGIVDFVLGFIYLFLRGNKRKK